MIEPPVKQPKKLIYTSEKLFMAYVASLRINGVPALVTKSNLGMDSYGRQVSLYSALYAMGFIRVDGVPQPSMHKLASPIDAERNEALLEGLEKVYPYLLGKDAKIDIAKVTNKEIKAEIARHTAFEGSTLVKATSFFVMVAQGAGFGFRPDVLKRHRTILPPMPQIPTTISAPKDAATIFAELMASLPKYDPNWPEDRQKAWFSLAEGNQRIALEGLPKKTSS